MVTADDIDAAEEVARADAVELAKQARRVAPEDGIAAIQLLARAFHSLRGRAGVEPWDPEALYRWAARATEAERCAVRFVLTVWNEDTIPYLDKHAGSPRSLGAFDGVSALSRWDRQNRAAFVTWAADPWWP